MSIDISRKQEAKVREDLNVSCVRFFCLKQDVQDVQDEQDDSTSLRGCLAPPKTIGARVAIAIKVLTDLFCLLLRRSIDIKVFQTFFFLILQILCILYILLQTVERMRGTGPVPTGAGTRFFSQIWFPNRDKPNQVHFI